MEIGGSESKPFPMKTVSKRPPRFRFYPFTLQGSQVRNLYFPPGFTNQIKGLRDYIAGLFCLVWKKCGKMNFVALFRFVSRLDASCAVQRGAMALAAKLNIGSATQGIQSSRHAGCLINPKTYYSRRHCFPRLISSRKRICPSGMAQLSPRAQSLAAFFPSSGVTRSCRSVKPHITGSNPINT